MDIKNIKRITVKVGTSTLTHDTGKLNLKRIDKLARVLSDLKNAGKDIVLVTSGAIGVGVAKLPTVEYPLDTKTKQAAAAVGQVELMYIYDKFFAEYGNIVAQILLTKDCLEHSCRRQNTINTLDELLSLGVIPVINENDTVAVDEIVFGDNDTLSAQAAVLTGSQLLILLTDIDGLYDNDPKKNKDAHIIRRIHKVDDELYSVAAGAGTNRGTGGMITKLRAAEICLAQGVDVAILDGSDPAIVYDLLDGKEVGSYFSRD